MNLKLKQKKTGLLILLLVLGLCSFSQNRKISGMITDNKNELLPGVTIYVKGTTNGTTSDMSGSYTLTVDSDAKTLVFSYIGMKTSEVEIGTSSQLNVTLQPEIVDVEEVVVVGYGTQKRSDISGSVATVNTDKLIAIPTTDIQGMLKGKVAGLYVTTADARPGGSSAVLLRGIHSLKGGNAPLYVVDGVPMGSINELNINDVESMSVLKDAASQAIYGARASNGVILITTKRGTNTNNKIKVSYNGYYSIQNVDPNFEIFSPEEYLQLRREAYRGDLANSSNNWIGTYPDDNQMFTPLEMESIANNDFVNWTDYAFKKNVPLTKHDISISGGNEKTQYSASLGYYYQDGLRLSSDLSRYSGKLALDQKISKTFKTGLSVYYTNYTQAQETNSWIDFITFSPVSKIYDEKGELVRYPTGDGKSVNPLYYEQTRSFENIAERIILNGYLEITPDFLPGLKYKLNANLNSRVRESNSFQSFEDPSSINQGYASVNFLNIKEYLVENIFTYYKKADQNVFDITLMQGIEIRDSESTTSTALQLGNDFFGVNSLGSALESEVGRNVSNRSLVSFMGRVNYTFNDRYIAGFTMRADGSSVFGSENKWGYFPSGSIAWNLHKESFLQNAKWLNEAKFRASYGQIGNQAIEPYGSLATADNSFYVTGDKPVVGYLPGSALPNPELKWETTTTLNIGLDFSVIENRLSGSFEVYKSNTTDLLVDRQLPTVLGYSRIPTNLGEIENTGIETSITGYIIQSKDLNWSVTANLSRNRNKLIKGVLQDPVTGEYIDDISNKWFIGEPITVYYDYKFSGIWQISDNISGSAQPNARPGDIKVADLSGPDGVPDGKITADDRIVIYRDPKWFGSFITNLSYKNLEFSAELYSVQGVVKNNVFLNDFNHGGRMDGILNGIKQNYWTPENPTGTSFRPHQTNYSDFRGTMGYQDASYIRLRNVTLAYNLPAKTLNAIGISRAKIYISGDNIWTKTDFLSYSPEGDPDDYPETRNFTIGLNINF